MDSGGAYLDVCSFGNRDGGLFITAVTRVQRGILCAFFQDKSSLVQGENDSISVVKQPRLYHSQLGINAMFHRIRFNSRSVSEAMVHLNFERTQVTASETAYPCVPVVIE